MHVFTLKYKDKENQIKRYAFRASTWESAYVFTDYFCDQFGLKFLKLTK